MFDLVIRGGTVVDGSGRPRYRADVGVRDGRITSIGRITETGTEEVDAEGRFVAPGFIEIHTHMDAQVAGAHFPGMHFGRLLAGEGSRSWRWT